MHDFRRVSLALAIAAAAAALVPATADAFVYWGSYSGVGRANLDGSGADPYFVDTAPVVEGVAVDADHVYWANPDSGAVGRANIDGSGAEESFIGGLDSPSGVAVDGSHVYWTDGSDSIGRANLDGSSPDPNFIPGANGLSDVAVGANHVYWTNIGSGTVGRANLDGSGVNQSFLDTYLPGLFQSPGGIAVDASHIYLTSFIDGKIARANLDGSGYDVLVIGAGTPVDVAVDEAYLYWADNTGLSIERTGLEGGFGSELVEFGPFDMPPLGIAVDDDPPETKITKHPPNKAGKRKVKFQFTSSDPGATFECKLDKKDFQSCDSPYKKKVKLGKHKFQVRAISADGRADPTPATDKFKVVG